MMIHRQDCNAWCLSNPFDPTTSLSIFLTLTTPALASRARRGLGTHGCAEGAGSALPPALLLGTSSGGCPHTCRRWPPALQGGSVLLTPGFQGGNSWGDQKKDPDPLTLSLISVFCRSSSCHRSVVSEKVLRGSLLPKLDDFLRLSLQVADKDLSRQWCQT